MASYRSTTFYNMLPGDALIAEINRTCKGNYLEINLKIASELASYNALSGESLTFDEFVKSLQSHYVCEAEKDP